MKKEIKKIDFERLDKLLDSYLIEIENANKNGLLTESTAKTYKLHSTNFVRWCHGDFEPGATNK